MRFTAARAMLVKAPRILRFSVNPGKPVFVSLCEPVSLRAHPGSQPAI
jgi:hypothetical protein